MRPVAAPLLCLAIPAAAAAQILREPVTKTFTAIPVGAPPVSLVASPTTTSIYLRWGCPEGASGYDVYVTPSSGVQTKLTPTPIPAQCVQDLQTTKLLSTTLTPTTSTATIYSIGFTHSGLVPGSPYAYVVVAIYPNGAQGATNPLAVRANLIPGPAVGGVATTGRNALLTWGAMAGATGIYVYRKLAGQADFRLVSTQGSQSTSFTDPTILPPGQHQYTVQAINGLLSPVVTVTLPPVPAPGGFQLQDFLGDARLNWALVPGATGYLVFRQRQGEPGFTQITAAPLTSFFNTPEYTDQGAPNGQRTSYYVKAVDGGATAPLSVVIGIPRWIQIRMYPGSPTLDLNWSGGYQIPTKVLRGPTPTGPFIDIPKTQYFDQQARVPGNVVGVAYYYKIQVVYPTGVAESVVIALKVSSEPKGETCYGSINEKGAVTWQFPACYY